MSESTAKHPAQHINPSHEVNEGYPNLATELVVVARDRIEKGLPKTFVGGSEIQPGFKGNLHLDLFDNDTNRVISIASMPTIDDHRRSIKHNGHVDFTSITVHEIEPKKDIYSLDEPELQHTTYVFGLNQSGEVFGVKKREYVLNPAEKPKAGVLSKIMARVSERKRARQLQEEFLVSEEAATVTDDVVDNVNLPVFEDLIRAVKESPIDQSFKNAEEHRRLTS